jgi:hypothetical protein
MLIFVVFAGLSFWYPDTQAGFLAAVVLSALSSWVHPCPFQLGFGALIALIKLSLISFFLIEGSAAIIALPLVSLVFATAMFSGVFAIKILRFLIALRR